MLEPEIVQPLKSLDADVGGFLIASLSVAIVAILETLISAKIASGRVDRPFNTSLEMRGLTIAHAVCGVTGAMPPTGVFVRTSLNTSLGATHRFSQFLNAAVVAIISLALMPVFSYLPQATIAAILVVASIRMTPITYLKKLWKEDKSSLALCLITAAVCVGEDPVIGLAAGMALAFLMAAMKQLQSPFVDIRSVPDGEGGLAYHVQVLGSLTYVNSEVFIDRARHVPGATSVSLDCSGLRQIDHDGASAIGKVRNMWLNGQEKVPAAKVTIDNVRKSLLPILRKFPWLQQVEAKGFLVTSL
jgi:SulP family sulfate permease